MTQPVWLTPATGDVFPASKKRGWGWISFGFLALITGPIALYFKWYWLGGGALYMAAMTMWLGSHTAFGARRLIIGTDCVQKVERASTVTDHIPFANIAELRFVSHVPDFIGINLHDIADPLSYSKTGFGSMKDHNGFDEVIVDIYVALPKEVYSKLEHSLRAFLDKKEAANS
jgi:hypothetical protein